MDAAAGTVAQVLEHLTVGGAEQLAVRIANARAATGAPSLVYALQGGGPLAERVTPPAVMREIGVVRSSVRNPLAFGHSLLRGRRRLLQQLATDGVEIVQTHLPEANFWGLLLTQAHRVGVVATVHNNAEFHYGDHDSAARRSLRRAAYRQVVARCDATVAVSSAVRDSLIAELSLPDRLAGRIVVVANGVDIPDPLPEAVREAVRRDLGVPNDTPLAIGAGRLTAQKNFQDLIAAAGKLRDAGVDCYTVIAGEGEDRSELEDAIARMGLASRVRLLGVRDDLGRLFQAADLFVLSSLWEGLPLVLLEAMAAGCPVAGYAIEGAADVLTDGREGRLVAAGGVDLLAEAMADLLTEPDVRRLMGAEARALVARDHDFGRVIAQLDELYARIAEQRR